MVLATMMSAGLALFFLAGGRRRKKPSAIARLNRLHGGSPDADAHSETLAKRLALAALLIPYRASPGRFKQALIHGIRTDAAVCEQLPAEALAGLRFWASAIIPAFLVVAARFSPVVLALAPAMAVAGFSMPGLVVARGERRFHDSIRQQLPQVADILYALVLGGKNLDQAFHGAAEATRGPLGSLLMSAVREMELGATRGEAFNRVLERYPIAELASLLRSLIEAERRGHGLTETLEVFSREIRVRRRDQLRIEVAKAPLKMLAPLVLLILPASIILTVGPTFLATLGKIF